MAETPMAAIQAQANASAGMYVLKSTVLCKSNAANDASDARASVRPAREVCRDAAFAVPAMTLATKVTPMANPMIPNSAMYCK
jgi:hypothetical protein